MLVAPTQTLPEREDFFAFFSPPCGEGQGVGLKIGFEKWGFRLV